MTQELKPGPATCPTGILRGHDADELRATRLDNGLVVCFICGAYAQDIDPSAISAIHTLPVELRQLLADLTSSDDPNTPTFAIRSIECSGHRDRSIAELELAAVSDIDLTVQRSGVTLNGPRYSFHSLILEHTKIPSWEANPVRQLDIADLTALNPPPRINRAAEVLMRHGFIFTAVANAGSLIPSVVMRFPAGPNSGGINATLSWIIR